MLLGHYGVAFAAKKVAPKTSLGILVIAATVLDLLWPLFLLFGVEHVRVTPGITKVTPLDFYHYPFSHSLLAVLIWGVLFGGLYFLWKRSKRDAIIVGLLVCSHWFLDLLVHRPDLPFGFSGEYLVGFGLWNIPILTYVLEFGILIVGVWMYMKTTYARSRVGKYALYSLLIFLSVIYVLNVTSTPPSNTMFIAIGGNMAWLMVLWSFWIEKHRPVKERPPLGGSPSQELH